MDTKTSSYHLTHHHHHLHQQTKKQTSAAAVIVRSRPVQFAQTLARVFRIGRKEKISKKAANKVRGHDAQLYLKNFLPKVALLPLPGRAHVSIYSVGEFSRAPHEFPYFFLPVLPPSEIRRPERAAPLTTSLRRRLREAPALSRPRCRP